MKPNAQLAKRLTATDFDPQATPNAAINCGAAKIWILAAAVHNPVSRKNATSIVVMIRMGDFEAIITGDATFATENVIMGRYDPAWLDVDLLRIGHHGSFATSTSAKWAATLTPQIAIVSAGYENSFGHPRGEVIDRVTPFTRPAPPHGFRSALLNPNSGPKYIFSEWPEFSESVYATAMSGTVVVTTQGAGYTVVTER